MNIYSEPDGWAYDPQPLGVAPAVKEHWDAIASHLDQLLLRELTQVLTNGGPDHIIVSTSLSVLQRYSNNRGWHRLSDETHPPGDAAQAAMAAVGDAIAGRIDDSDAVRRLRAAVGV